MSIAGRTLNVALAPGSAAHHATRPPHPKAGAGQKPHLAPGFTPQPGWNLREGQGRTIKDLVFVNRYAGPAGAWDAQDMSDIDVSLDAAMTDAALQSVIAQYYDGPISSRMLASARHETPLPATVHKDAAEALAVKLHGEDALGGADPASSVINVMLPKGTVLSDDYSPGFHGAEDEREEHERLRKGRIRLKDDDAASSKEGLGGYHGSVRTPDGTTIYYAVGAYSEGHNGIPAFAEPWKSVVATFYHELNEARTDPDVELVDATGDGSKLGWYSQTGQGEIGDLPINECGGDLGLVFQEVPRADGNGTVPIQLMWSNLADGPATAA